jgi:hypothetical protein
VTGKRAGRRPRRCRDERLTTLKSNSPAPGRSRTMISIGCSASMRVRRGLPRALRDPRMRPTRLGTTAAPAPIRQDRTRRGEAIPSRDREGLSSSARIGHVRGGCCGLSSDSLAVVGARSSAERDPRSVVRLIRGSANVAFTGGFAAARIGQAYVGEKSPSSTPTVTSSAQLCDTLKGVRPHHAASAVPRGGRVPL